MGEFWFMNTEQRRSFMKEGDNNMGQTYWRKKLQFALIVENFTTWVKRTYRRKKWIFSICANFGEFYNMGQTYWRKKMDFPLILENFNI